jgi:hypothetical protein
MDFIEMRSHCRATAEFDPYVSKKVWRQNGILAENVGFLLIRGVCEMPGSGY